MDKGEDPKKRDKHLRQMAKEAMEKHCITQAQRYSMGARWLIQRPYSIEFDDIGFDWTMAAEIVVMAGGRIVVWGDLYPVMFAHYGPFQNPKQVIDWMGKCKDLGYYVRQKARIGCPEIVDVWEADVARFQLLEIIGDEKKAKRQERSHFVLAVEEALKDHLEERQQFLDFIYDELGYDGYESLCHVGMVLSPRVYYAHAVLARLSELLDQEEKENGKQNAESGRDAGEGDSSVPVGTPDATGNADTTAQDSRGQEPT